MYFLNSFLFFVCLACLARLARCLARLAASHFVRTPVFTSVQLRFSSFLWLFLFRMRGNLLIYLKMFISRLLWGDRWKLQREIQRHAIVTTYMFMTLWPVWGYFRVDQPTSTCFKWHTSISVYLQRTSDRSNSHERRCSTRNLDDMHTIWSICL